jgi:hypothetical protein
MKPVLQVNLGPPDGDCHRACIASILEQPLEDIPNFIEDDRWWDRLNAWLINRHNCYLLHFESDRFFDETHIGYVIANGPSPRGPFLHSTVYFRNSLAHDPYPGFAESPKSFDVFVLFDPARRESGSRS